MEKHVYVIEANSLVKIGVSISFEERLKTLSMQGGFTPQRVFHTEKTDLFLAIESSCHLHFKSKIVIGEWFSVSFDEAVSFLRDFYEEVNDKDRPLSQAPAKKEIDQEHVNSFATYLYPGRLPDAQATNRSDMLSMGWTDEAVCYVESLSKEDADCVLAISRDCCAVNIIDSEYLHQCYPGGYEKHDKEKFIASYDKKEIASECGIEDPDDVADWDSFLVYVNEGNGKMPATS